MPSQFAPVGSPQTQQHEHKRSRQKRTKASVPNRPRFPDMKSQQADEHDAGERRSVEDRDGNTQEAYRDNRLRKADKERDAHRHVQGKQRTTSVKVKRASASKMTRRSTGRFPRPVRASRRRNCYPRAVRHRQQHCGARQEMQPRERARQRGKNRERLSASSPERRYDRTPEQNCQVDEPETPRALAYSGEQVAYAAVAGKFGDEHDREQRAEEQGSPETHCPA